MFSSDYTPYSPSMFYFFKTQYFYCTLKDIFGKMVEQEATTCVSHLKKKKVIWRKNLSGATTLELSRALELVICWEL